MTTVQDSLKTATSFKDNNDKLQRNSREKEGNHQQIVKVVYIRSLTEIFRLQN